MAVIESTFYQTMQADREGNKFGLGLIIFLVFIGVLNTVLMSVLERTRELACSGLWVAGQASSFNWWR